MRGSIFDTPGGRLFLSRWRTQQCAVTATHQGDAVLNQADRPAAKIVAFPGAAVDSLPAEQAFGNLAIAISLQPSVEGPYG